MLVRRGMGLYTTLLRFNLHRMLTDAIVNHSRLRRLYIGLALGHNAAYAYTWLLRV